MRFDRKGPVPAGMLPVLAFSKAGAILQFAATH